MNTTIPTAYIVGEHYVKEILEDGVTEYCFPDDAAAVCQQAKQKRFYLQARRQWATKPVPGWVAVIAASALFGAIMWTMLEVGFWRMGL